jgi:hypothetical protein
MHTGKISMIMVQGLCAIMSFETKLQCEHNVENYKHQAQKSVKK